LRGTHFLRDTQETVVAGAERAAVLYWARQANPSSTLTDVVRAAVGMAVRGMAAGS
jgi:hypothetical protein